MISRKQNLIRGISNCIIVLMLCTLVFFSIDKTAFSANADPAVPYYCGDVKSNCISLMFNVYWGTEFIEPILEVLNKYEVKATFFVGGSWVEKNYEVLKKIYENGHEIGNHGYLHKDHKTLSKTRNREEILLTDKLIFEYLGKNTKLFAPPSGSFGNDTLTICKELGFAVIMWSKDTIDWRDKDSGLVYSRATKNAKGGDLVLMHPTRHTLKALPDILEYYRANGLKEVTVSENLKLIAS